METLQIRSSILNLYNRLVQGVNPQMIADEIRVFNNLPESEKNLIRERKLLNTLKRAYQEVPYYRNLFDEKNLSFRTEGDLINFQKIPLLTKSIIRENFNILKKSSPGRMRWRKDSTSGSTGKPLVFLTDNAFYKRKLGLKQYEFETNGRLHKDTLIVFWGFHRQDEWEFPGIVMHRISNWLRNRIELDVDILNDRIIAKYVKIIQNQKSVVIQAYSQAIYKIARYINQSKINIENVKFVITSASTLFDFMREEIEAAFNCRVNNRYGSREFGLLAFQKLDEPDLSVITSECIIEALNSDGNHCEPGQEGEVVITSLNNFAFPFIRYKIGDMAIPGEISSHPVLSCLSFKRISGRIGDSLVREDGSLISSHFLPRVLRKLFNEDWLEDLQITQNDYKKITVDLVLTGKILLDNVKIVQIKAPFYDMLGDDCDIQINIVDHIEKKGSWKYKFIRTEIS